jgi:hypothetical protein
VKKINEEVYVKTQGIYVKAKIQEISEEFYTVKLIKKHKKLNQTLTLLKSMVDEWTEKALDLQN